MELEQFVQSWQQPEVRAGLVIAFAAFVLWRVPVLGWPLYPLHIFGVFIHELSHGLASMLTGGRFHRFVITPEGSGLATVSGGSLFVAGCAGYLGTAFLGALLLLLAAVGIPARIVLLLMGLGFGLLCLIFVRNFFGIVTGALLGAALIAAAIWLHDFALDGLLWLLAIHLFLSTFTYLFALLNHASRPGTSDAHVLAGMTGLHPAGWVIVWMLIALAVLLFALNRMYGIPLPWELLS